MSNSPQISPWLTQAIQKHPLRSKIIAWTFIATILVGGGWAIWNSLSQGKYFRLAFVGSLAAWIAIKHYRTAKEHGEVKPEAEA